MVPETSVAVQRPSRGHFSVFWQVLLWAAQRRNRYRVEGSSMEPSMRDGDYLLVAPWRGTGLSDPIVRGDVVVVQHPLDRERVVVKRLEKATLQGLWLLGDNPEGTDSRQFGAVSWTLLLGRVTAHIGRPRR